jgi:hypothetical protein
VFGATWFFVVTHFSTWQIDEILITLPNDFVHLVEKPTDLQLMNEACGGYHLVKDG